MVGKLKKIESFCIDHTKLTEGIYISRVDGDITTYDIRFVKPNTPPFLENAALHTIEHIFATYVRSGRLANNVIYFGPMGCRTGFYLLLRDTPKKDAIALIKSALIFIENFEGDIPGASAEECGNYLEHDLAKAKLYVSKMVHKIQNWTEGDLSYKE